MTNKEFALVIVSLMKNKCTQIPMGKDHSPYLKLNLDNEEVYKLFNEIMGLARDIEAINEGASWN